MSLEVSDTSSLVFGVGTGASDEARDLAAGPGGRGSTAGLPLFLNLRSGEITR